jgi:antitoxin ParD1/3/4
MVAIERKAKEGANSRIEQHGIICQSQCLPRTNMPTRNVVLTAHQATFVDHLVRSGRYQNASEVLRDGLRLIEREEAEIQARLEALRDAARSGLSDVEAGRLRSFASAQELALHLDRLAEDELAPSTEGQSARRSAKR